MNIPMVDLKKQYQRIKSEIDAEVLSTIESAWFIGGERVKSFQSNLENYLGVKHVIPCANGTDALQIALMALDLEEGSEIIVPSFTYVATAEVIALLKLKPVMVDVDPHTYNVTAKIIEKAITLKTKAIVPVHLFGQSCDMQPIMELATARGISVIEDNAQTIGAIYTYEDGTTQSAGTIGDIGTTSFFPSKNLGCYGDGGAIFTNNDNLAAKIRMIANHGQSRKYYHDVIGCNSRLDAIQAGVLNVKLKYLDDYSNARQVVADTYDKAFENVEGLIIPAREKNSTHVFHQYVLRVKQNRDGLMQHILDKGIGCNIYYPVPLYEQKAFSSFHNGEEQAVTEQLCKEVFALPIHTEMDKEALDYIIAAVLEFVK
ncbi:MAG: UDP-2-acetamido-2-deoxy-ribo-hexuluronate aminotransferase [Maribacter sp.]|jgi:UDP-2-acetamido-2-deoxy-ribo-hexuluronate aminotransferase